MTPEREARIRSLLGAEWNTCTIPTCGHTECAAVELLAELDGLRAKVVRLQEGLRNAHEAALVRLFEADIEEREHDTTVAGSFHSAFEVLDDFGIEIGLFTPRTSNQEGT